MGITGAKEESSQQTTHEGGHKIGKRCTGVRDLYLNLDTDLHDLGGWNPERCGREIGVEVHQRFAPHRHA
jgi:hypothetical protein